MQPEETLAEIERLHSQIAAVDADIKGLPKPQMVYAAASYFDPIGTFRAPANGTYRVLVQERYGKGGPRYQYVLRLTKVVPDFYPVAFHETPSDPTCP